MLPFEIWFPIATFVFVIVTVHFVRALRKRKDSFWENARKWIVDVIDTLSGG